MAETDVRVVTSDGPDQGNELPDKNVQAVADEGLDARLKQIVERSETMVTGWQDNTRAALEDDKFVAGDQWEQQVRDERETDGRPVHTYNLLLTYCNHIVNAMRQNRPQVKLAPVNTMRGKSPTMANVAGTEDYSLSDVYMGIIRNIEHQSKASHAYDTAAEHQVQHGFGYFRLMPVYTRDDVFTQDLRIMRVMNAYSVLVDPSAQEADYGDMQDAFVISKMPRKVFKQKWPDAAAVDFSEPIQGSMYQYWFNQDDVTVAEYMWIEHTSDKVLQLSNGKICYESDVAKILDELEDNTGVHVVQERAVKRPKCMWQKMTAVSILQGPLELPFTSIPIFPVLGKELIVDQKVMYKSAIRDAKDAQRAFNYWKTAATETVGYAPKAPWLVTAKQIQGYEGMWDQANKKNQPYLIYRHQDGVPQPQRIFPTGIAAAELAQADNENMVMQDIIGMHEADKGEQGNEKSGVAIKARQSRGDMAVFTFPDNFSRTMERLGRLLCEAIPIIYNTQRIVRILKGDDTEDFVEINQTLKDEQTGDVVSYHDIGYCKFDVTIDTGPSFASQREQANETITGIMEVLPDDQARHIAHLAVKNMEFPGADEVHRLLRKMLPDELKTQEQKEEDLPQGYTFNEEGQPVNEEGEPLPQDPPTPEQQVALAESAAKEKTAEATGKKADADIAGSEADMAKHDATRVQAEATIEVAKQKVAEATAPQNNGDDGREQEMILNEVKKLIDDAMKTHNLEVDDKILDAVVETLKRVKSHMDTNESAGGNAGEGGAPGVIVQVPKTALVKHLEFTKDAEGNTTGVTPTYDEEDSPSKITKINFKHGADGTIEEAVPEYESGE